MRWYIIKNGVVSNFIVADQDFIDAEKGVYFDEAIESSTVPSDSMPDIGWSYVDGVFAPPPS